MLLTGRNANGPPAECTEVDDPHLSKSFIEELEAAWWYRVDTNKEVAGEKEHGGWGRHPYSVLVKVHPWNVFPWQNQLR